MPMYGYVWQYKALYDYEWLLWLCIAMYDYVELSRIMYDYIWLCMTMYDHVWRCLTMYEYVWLSYKREKKSNFKNFFILLPSFWNYQNFSNNSKKIPWFKCFKFVILFNKPWQGLPLFSFVYLCSTDASMHKFCACYLLLANVTLKLAK